MAYSHIATAAAVGGSTGATTAGIDTTGATLIVVGVARFGAVTISDNKGNGAPTLVRQEVGPVLTLAIYMWVNPTVGSGHTFTVSGGSAFASIGGAAFSGSAASSPADQVNSADSASATTIQPGSITPSEDNELVICLGGAQAPGTGGNYSISLLTELTEIQHTASYFGQCLAYEIQTTATARNPTFGTLTAADDIGAAIASFKAAAAPPGGTGSPIVGPGALIGGGVLVGPGAIIGAF